MVAPGSLRITRQVPRTKDSSDEAAGKQRLDPLKSLVFTSLERVRDGVGGVNFNCHEFFTTFGAERLYGIEGEIFILVNM